MSNYEGLKPYIYIYACMCMEVNPNLTHCRLIHLLTGQTLLVVHLNYLLGEEQNNFVLRVLLIW